MSFFVKKSSFTSNRSNYLNIFPKEKKMSPNNEVFLLPSNIFFAGDDTPLSNDAFLI